LAPEQLSVFLECDAASLDNWCLMIRDNVMVSSSKVKKYPWRTFTYISSLVRQDTNHPMTEPTSQMNGDLFSQAIVV
jgi:hypothetical protein